MDLGSALDAGAFSTAALDAMAVGDLVDEVAAADRMLASVSAHRAELIDAARRRSETGQPDLSRAPGALADVQHRPGDPDGARAATAVLGRLGACRC